MMAKILVVNGEKYWQDLMPAHEVVQKKVQHSTWVLRAKRLIVIDESGPFEPDLILWRVGAIPPSKQQVTVLHIIELSGVPCVNSAACLLKGYDRLSMLGAMKQLAMPVIEFHVVSSPVQLKNIGLEFPFVVKAGNFHGGIGKVLVRNQEEWQDIKDLSMVTDHYVTVEPFIDYKRDIRYLMVEDSVWAMSRKGLYWKANAGKVYYEPLEPESSFIDKLKVLKAHTGADLIAIDILEDKSGEKYIVEYNDIPGFSGFPESLKYQLVDLIERRLTSKI